MFFFGGNDGTAQQFTMPGIFSLSINVSIGALEIQAEMSAAFCGKNERRVMLAALTENLTLAEGKHSSYNLLPGDRADLAP